MKKTLLVILVLIQTGSYAQNKKPKDPFNVQVRADEGDLNKDGLKDKVVVMMDTISDKIPLRLQVFFSQPNKKSKLVVSSTQIIEPQYPAGRNGKHTDNQIPNFFIEDGDLKMLSDIKNGQSEHKFRFQNGNFELIYVWQTTYDGKNTTTETVFNLLTGIRTVSTHLLGTNKDSIKSKNKITIRPLPKLQDFIPFKTKYY